MKFESEAHLCETFIKAVPKGWTVYPETAGFDIVLVRNDGIQVGVEAKLQFNVKVLEQASETGSCWRHDGPDYRAVLVPAYATDNLCTLAKRLAVTVLRCAPEKVSRQNQFEPGLPVPGQDYRSDWFDICPAQQLMLPDYVPRVKAGVPSPIQLTNWTINSMRLMVILERRGFITRRDLEALRLSPSRWASNQGYLEKGEVRGQWVASKHMPRFPEVHPEVWAEIQADESWQKPFDMRPEFGSQKALAI